MLLVNVLNQVKHSDQKIDAALINATAERIAKQDKYKKYTAQLNNAVHDITEYFNELELYGYLEKTRAIKWEDTKLPSNYNVKIEEYALKKIGLKHKEDKTIIDDKIDAIYRLESLFNSYRIGSGIAVNIVKETIEGIRGVAIHETESETKELGIQYKINLDNTISENRSHLNLQTTYINSYLQMCKFGDTGFGKNKIGYADWQLMKAIRDAHKDKAKIDQLLQKAGNMQLEEDEIDILDMYTINRYMNALDDAAYETIFYSTDLILYNDMMRLERKLITRFGIDRSDPKIYKKEYDNKCKELAEKLG
ncbi:MAG: hypothetical protein IJS10_00830 [Alphaproteobacteria bacterium]|nr:hypothetical protein [Alphaproteobacteria bacterium]